MNALSVSEIDSIRDGLKAFSAISPPPHKIHAYFLISKQVSDFTTSTGSRWLYIQVMSPQSSFECRDDIKAHFVQIWTLKVNERNKKYEMRGFTPDGRQIHEKFSDFDLADCKLPDLRFLYFPRYQGEAGLLMFASDYGASPPSPIRNVNESIRRPNSIPLLVKVISIAVGLALGYWLYSLIHG